VPSQRGNLASHCVSGMPKTSERASAGKFEVVFRHVLFRKYIYIYIWLGSTVNLIERSIQAKKGPCSRIGGCPRRQECARPGAAKLAPDDVSPTWKHI
jgi:hypothetical protein